MALSDPPIVGRPAVLWQLTDPDQLRISCEAGEVADGRLRVRVLHGNEEQRTATFTDPAVAIRWAFDIQRTLVREGCAADM
jgi:hypothetical protein